MFKAIDAQTYTYKSKSIDWGNSGNGDATFDGSFIPDTGPNGGILVIDRFVLHATLSLTVATATTKGQDLYRAFRNVTVTQIDGEKRYDQLSGDSLRIVNFAQEGAGNVHEHADFAAGGPTSINFTALVPLAKTYAHEADDYSLPAHLFRELRIGMAQGTDMSLGTSVVTVNSGSYWVIAECHEEMGVVWHAVDTISEQDFDTTLSGTFNVNGRPQDLYLFIRGQTGGATLANLTDVFIPTNGIYNSTLLKDPDLKQRYGRLRGAAANLATTAGDPLRSDPFTGATLRAVAALLVDGDKAFEGPECRQMLVRTSQASSISLRGIVRATKRRSDVIGKIVRELHGVNTFRVKTAGKSRQDPRAWKPEHLAYMPLKGMRVVNGKPESFHPFQGRR